MYSTADYGAAFSNCDQADLGPAIAVAMRGFQKLQAPRRETGDLKQALVDRKVIEQAKGILMEVTGADENVHFTVCNNRRGKNQKLIDAAHHVVALEKTLRPAGS